MWEHDKTFNTFQRGLEFQDFICEILFKEGIIVQNFSSKKYQYEIGENKQGFEIKLDALCTKTKRLSIEIAEKKNSNNQEWINSGIYGIGNSWMYIQGNYEIIFIFPKNILVALHKSKKYEEVESHGTIKKFYLPFDESEKWASKIIKL